MSWLDEPTTTIPTAAERELIQLEQAKSLVRDGREWSEEMTTQTKEAVKSYADRHTETIPTMEPG